MATSVLAAITYAQQLCQTDSNGIGSVLGLSFYNDAYQAWTRDMLNRNIDAAQTQEAYRDITTNSPNTYLWPSDMYALKTVEVNWQDNQQQNYLQATALDVANIQGVSFSYLRANQTQQAPLIDNRGDQFELFPSATTPNAQGIRIFYYLTPTEVTNVGQPINYPQLLDYRTLSFKMASLYYLQQNDTVMAERNEAEYQTRISRIISILAPGTQQPVRPVPLQMTGWNF